MRTLTCFYCALLFFFTSCSSPQQKGREEEPVVLKKSMHNPVSIDSLATPEQLEDTLLFPEKKKEYGSIEQQLLSLGFQDVQLQDSSIQVKLMYATTDNFTHINLYRDFTRCFLPPAFTKKILKAQQALQELKPGYSLLVWDATRPHHIQQMMWDTLKLPFKTKINYLAHPDSISLHNYGAAIDLTIVDEQGKELDMGTGFDFFGPLAEPRLETKLLAEGKLNQAQIDNRQLLRNVMKKGGYWPVPTEWWHFNAANRKWAAEHLVLVK